VHLPVPRDRDDEAYFAPLAGLELDAGTRLHLGLLHLADGQEGAARRRAAATAQLTRPFGVGTECGFGRQKPEDVRALLELHRSVADQVTSG
jgi:bacterioferritin-associated ferredoxin